MFRLNMFLRFVIVPPVLCPVDPLLLGFRFSLCVFISFYPYIPLIDY